MKKGTILIAFALISSLAISHFSERLSYEERLVRAGLKDALGSDADGLIFERPELQALFLDYSETPELVLKGRIALSKYEDHARKILTMYGSAPEFRDILIRYGENVIPVIQYFIENDPFSIRMEYLVQQKAESVADKAKEMWSGVEGEGEDRPASEKAKTEFDATARGWYAVRSIRNCGHDFLGQFEITPDNEAKWIQTERLLEGVSSFFASGVRNLETKYALDKEIEATDLFWAGVDSAVFVSAVKALRFVRMARAGKAVRTGEMLEKSGKELSLLNRTKLFAGRLIPKGALGRTILKGGAGVALVYVALRHPGVLNSLFSEAAKALGLDPFLVQVACWAALIFFLCLPVMPILRVLIRLLIRVLSLVLQVLGHHGAPSLSLPTSAHR